MPWSVVHEGKVIDVVCRKHSAGKKHKEFRKWYVIYVGDKMLGQTMLSFGGWHAISNANPEMNWMAKGFASRRYAIEFMLRNSGYWKKD